MSKLEKLIKDVGESFVLTIEDKPMAYNGSSPADVLLNLPLITMIILIGSYKKIVTVENSSHLVTRTLMELYENFFNSLQQLRFSSSLREKSIESIVFLEKSGMIASNQENDKKILISSIGKKLIANFNKADIQYSDILERIAAAIDKIKIKGWELL